MVAPVPRPWMMIPTAATAGTRHEAQRRHDPAGDQDGRDEPDDPPPAGPTATADDLADDVGDAWNRAAAAASAPTPPDAAGMNAWRTPSSKIPIAAAPANRIQNRRVRTIRRTLLGRSAAPTGWISRAAETAPGADASWRPMAARAATPVSRFAHGGSGRALTGSPTGRPARGDRGRAGVDGARSLSPRARVRSRRAAGTTIAGPLVIIQTNATPTRHEDEHERGRPPACRRISPAATGSAMAAPIPGPA